MIKKYAFFLPQFHEIEENNIWWGKGFTEWVNVKKATPLFKGHLQPKEPLDGYYNLLDKTVVEHQTKLMKDYNIDGLIYYHYYFTGKKLLEKPAENLLKWKDINQSFFFCWANHSWYKSWAGTKKLLIEQKYGSKEDWTNHFNYLLPFFLDKRYVKKNNKPIFMVFNSVFAEKKEMFEYFDFMCKKNGFDGIFIIDTCFNIIDYNKNKKLITNYEKYYFFREPDTSIQIYNKFILKKIYKKIINEINSKINSNLFIEKYNGNKLYKLLIKKIIKSKDIIHGLFFEWDNTPRHKNRGFIITPINKESFNTYMDTIKNEEFLFINAWNEWAEGMVLEGTVDSKYKYLEWIKEYFNK